MRLIWLLSGLFALSLGTVGLVLPLLPTVPFLLLAALCFARSSERLSDWLHTHKTFGPPIADWQNRGAIGRRAKWAASLSILASLCISWLLDVRPLLIGIQLLVLLGVSAFIWTRPDS